MSNRNFRRYPAVIACAVLVGLTLIISGTGKVPGQTEFADALLKSFWTPAMAFLIANLVPWIEMAVGGCLLIGILPGPAAIGSLGLCLGFLSNNIWALSRGIDQFPECASCFGFWENFFGHLSPLGAFSIDIVLLVLSIVVLVYSRHYFFTLRPWFIGNRLKPGVKSDAL